MADITAWHGKTFDEHTKLRDDAAKAGYRFLSLSLYGTTASPRYAAVMIKRAKVVAQRDWPALSFDEFQTKFNEQATKGYGPVMIAATGSASNPLFAAVFQPMSSIPLTRHGLRSGADSDLNTIQGMNKKAHADGLIPRWLAVYGDAADPRFAAIWVPNTGKVIWNADGLVETGTDYQHRFDAQTSGWCRPSLVTLNQEARYLSLFVDDEVGPWVARHGMTSDQYQNEFNSWTPKGYFPICVQGGGSGSSTRYAALFVKNEVPVAKQFQATGPIANAEIDAVIAQAMKDSPVRHGSLAIVKGTKLVYARAYTWGEPDWPLAQPTSRFRLASVSKTVMALAVYQLIAAGKLKLSDKMQDVLQLKTPAGGAPKDSRFKDVTVKHLLEHTSSLNANAYRNDLAVLQAHKAAKPAGNWNLPVTAEMTDSYVAALDLGADNPGKTQAYNNCGYYLLGRIVGKLRGKSAPIDALQDFLFDPLNVHRIRRAPSLIATTPADEARYRAQEIPVLPSVMSNDQPLVPLGYGHEQYAKQEGSGGLSAATTDLARLIAILISQKDNPALKRATIVDMLTAGAALSAAGMSRAGYGFDVLKDLGSGKFYGQKGGSLNTSGNVLQINGDWGFAMCWAGIATAATNWYPNYPAVMDVAKKVAWGSTDLFPQFGMPAL